MIFRRSMPRSLSGPLSTVLFIWMGTAFYLMALLFVLDLTRWMAVGAAALWAAITSSSRDTVADPMRRQAIARGAATIAGVAAAGASGLALRSGLGEVELKEVGVELERLPRALSGLTLVQLTDIHVGPTIGRRFIDAIVEKTNNAKPDAIMITGDLVDGPVEELLEHVAPLAKLKARYGVYFVTGNHEYYSGVRDWTLALEKMGIRVLREEHVELGEPGASIDLAGVSDHLSSKLAEAKGTELRRMLALSDPDRELVLLAHQPKAIISAAEAGVGLQISGHTHGGQLWPFSALVAMTQPYLAGLHRHGERTQIYVSRGTGYWGPPMRLFAPSEITKIVLGAA
jgi:predicted MPP superfamily phosphohydrolase